MLAMSRNGVKQIQKNKKDVVALNMTKIKKNLMKLAGLTIERMKIENVNNVKVTMRRLPRSKSKVQKNGA